MPANSIPKQCEHRGFRDSDSEREICLRGRCDLSPGFVRCCCIYLPVYSPYACIRLWAKPKPADRYLAGRGWWVREHEPLS